MPQYTVKGGDNLSTIAARYGVSVNQITGYSSGNPNLIRPGEVLNIPDKAPAPAPAPAPRPSAPAPAPAPAPAQPSYSAPSTGTTPDGIPISSLPPDLVYQGQLDVSNGVKQAKYNEILAQYKGNNQPSSINNPFNQPTINLQDIYNNAIKTSNVAGLQAEADAVQAQIDVRLKALADAKAKINDNPFYSEATRVGRIAKLEAQANDDIKNLTTLQGNATNKVSGAKADAQVALNIAAQQYNIQSQQYQQNVNMFNNLLTSGSLNNATSEDIGQIALATGMSTSMIKSIIGSAKAKESKPLLQTFDDGQNQYIVAINPNDGSVVSREMLGPSTALLSTRTGNTNDPGGGNFSTTQYNKAVDIIKSADIMNQKGNAKKADKKLAEWEIEAAIQQLAAYLGGDVEKAKELFLLVANSEGYSEWMPKS